ncbi:hypothetical protein OAI84_00575 [bacterium]|nr:hypothetical protein [bacterium]
MSEFKDFIIEECLNAFKNDNVKNEIKRAIKPILFSLFQEIYPYIFFLLILVIICFLLVLGIFFFLMRINKSLQK